jgi:hypothetical protein
VSAYPEVDLEMEAGCSPASLYLLSRLYVNPEYHDMNLHCRGNFV